LPNTTLIIWADQDPLEFLLFSDFAVVLAYVHLYTLFMVVPIFNSMMRIERSLLERRAMPGRPAGRRCVRHRAAVQARHRHRLDLSSFTIVMGDFVTVRMMSGGQSASVSLMMMNRHVAAAVSGGGGQRRGPAAACAVHRRRHDAHGRHP